MRNVSEKCVEKSVFSENRAVCEKISKSMVEIERPQMTK
jgi:hypothetical protein